ncbi:MULTISPECIES: NAD(P)H-binding protein [unclassified Sinorhizobium]|uniref:NAD(P)-dependent oxidoreductase n=1 Tax=unclassified Sinorhizobium TaxID=2613772 RepID=UPI0024C21C3B|nr:MULTISPECIES: NAD(P)H-binding protein [unclassified Sinorhizobium]MDK1376460.1 NAD(P)H-binding protein [Sinorhizobium sp. 6-70]MDK1480992.1 NAD(P)H-binding protein [Sinorhizobium sp. 6-117]
MKISLFGATGPTGQYIIREALSQGYSLSVYTRDANKLSLFEGKIEVVEGDLKNLEAIRTCVSGSHAVISALGPNSLQINEKRSVMHGVGNIISIMDELAVCRLIQVSTSSYRDPKDGFDLKSRAVVLLIKVMLYKAYDDIKATGELISRSGLDWTLVRIPYLKDGPADGSIDVGWYGKTKLSTKLSRGNLARFLVDQISNRDFVRAAPGIADHA